MRSDDCLKGSNHSRDCLHSSQPLFPDHVFFLQGNPFDHTVSMHQQENFFEFMRELPFHTSTEEYASLSDLYMVEPTTSFFCRVYDLLFRRIGMKDVRRLTEGVQTGRAECSGTLGYYGLSIIFCISPSN